MLQKRPDELVTEISNLLTPTWPASKIQWIAKDTREEIEKKVDLSYQHALILKSDVKHLIGLLEEILISQEVH